jgi:hypothetical protein
MKNANISHSELHSNSSPSNTFVLNEAARFSITQGGSILSPLKRIDQKGLSAEWLWVSMDKIKLAKTALERRGSTVSHDELPEFFHGHPQIWAMLSVNCQLPEEKCQHIPFRVAFEFVTFQHLRMKRSSSFFHNSRWKELITTKTKQVMLYKFSFVNDTQLKSGPATFTIVVVMRKQSIVFVIFKNL